MQLFRRLAYLLNYRRHDRELAQELEFHREMGGRVESPLRLREDAREAWGWLWIDRLGQDLRYAARTLSRSPGFTLAAVAMLAIGIGVNIAAFGFFDIMVLRPLPVRDPETLLHFTRQSPERYASAMPYPEMAFFRDHSRTLEIFAQSPQKLSLEGEAKPRSANAVSENYFVELGASPLLGRLIEPSDASGPPVVVLSEALWRMHFGADAAIAGKTLRLNGKPSTVVGVVPATFSGVSLARPELWIASQQQPYFIDGTKILVDFSDTTQEVLGRLRPGMTPKIAEAELRALAAELRKQYPNDIWENETLPSKPGGYASSAMNGSQSGSGQRGPDKLLPVIMMITALVLLILIAACGNLGSLLLARGVARQREISIRVAVGAGSGRLLRQLFTESLVLAMLGAAAGLALGWAVLRYLLSITDSPSWMNPTPDWRVITFAAGAGFASAMLFGLSPAFQLARQRQRANFLRQALLCAQVAASCVLLIVAALLGRAMNHALTADPGFDYKHAITIDASLAAHGYAPAKAAAFLDTLRARILAVPGVASVGEATSLPLGNRNVVNGFDVDSHHVDMHANNIDPAFFETMKIPLLRGRNFKPGDTNAIIVSQSLAARAWPSVDPLGREIGHGDGKATVVGIAGNARATALEDPDAVEGYFLANAADQPGLSLVVRTAADPESVLPAIATIARGIDPQVFPTVQAMRTAFDVRMRGAEYSAATVAVLGATALLLACLGIVGLVSFAVTQRTREIGVRMALGAKQAHIIAIVLRQFSRPVLLGLVAGTAGAAALSQVLRRLLYGISNLDPEAYIGAVAIFLAAVLAGSLLPARKALRIDPVRALHHD